MSEREIPECRHLYERIETLETENDLLLTALQFYAEAEILYLGKGDWRTPLDELTQDNGATARRALAPRKDCPHRYTETVTKRCFQCGAVAEPVSYGDSKREREGVESQ